MKDSQGNWVGLGLGDVDPQVQNLQSFMARKFAKTAGGLVATGAFDQATETVVKQLQANLGMTQTGIANYAFQLAIGFVKAAPKITPLLVSVEGHMSDMFHGPVADTFTILEQEGRGRHQPIGYNNGALPFDNKSGVAALYDVYSRETLLDGRPFPRGTKSVLGGYSQGGIVVYDFVTTYLLPGQELAWRTPDILGELAYGNPNRQTGSIAPWSVAQAGDRSSGGLDPKRRYGLPDNPDAPQWPLMDVWRRGDIFTDNEVGRSGQVKAAVYEAVARSDFFDRQYSLLAAIADLFKVPFQQVWAIFQAIVSGVGFLADQTNPHYAPFDISGGLDWVRTLLS